MKHKFKYQRNLGLPAMFLLLVFASSIFSYGQELEKILDLNGVWKFSIGDNREWAIQDYDDSDWENIWVPKTWEEQGFHGYDGYAWYRKTVKLPFGSDKMSYSLKLGYIDDVDEVYINGKKIGFTGQFPPRYTTAYNAHRIYVIPHKLLNNSESMTIAVRVFDEGGEGGIVRGDISISIDKSAIITDFDLQGDWKFSAGDCPALPKSEIYNNWNDVIVPGTWEDQGYKNYDGIACYAIEFNLDGQFENERMVLILGRIDDLDQVYLNGTLIGQSGDFTYETVIQRPDTYKQLRGYYLPPGILNDNGKNVLVVKVLDYTGLGGIWDGSVGLITQKNYINFWRKKRNSIK